jgi:hypothetical protein
MSNMSHYMLTVPEEVNIRARRIAEQTSQPVDEVMIKSLQTSFALLPELAEDEEAELEALSHLSDDALWTIAREQMPNYLQFHMQALMDKNSSGTISAEEYSKLKNLVDRGERLMLRKSEAAALLAHREYKITPDNLTI